METVPGIQGRKEWGIAADVRKLLSDDGGNLSSKRVLSMTWGFSALAVWINASLRGNTVAAIPWEVAGLVLSLAGVVAAGKFAETKEDNRDREKERIEGHDAR